MSKEASLFRNNQRLQINFEKILLFLFVSSWINLPGIFYEKFSWTILTAYHGHNIIPYFLPVLAVFVLYFLLRLITGLKFTNIYQVLQGLRFHIEDIFFLILIGTMVLINYITSVTNGNDPNLRMIFPIIWAHFFYFFYIRFAYISIIPNVQNYFIKSVLFACFLIIILQLLMNFGIIPGLSDPFSAEIIWKYLHFVRVNAAHIGFTSYLVFFILFILLNYKTNIVLSPFLYYSLISLILLILAMNQTRGAILGVVIVLLATLLNNFNIKKMLLLISILILSYFAYQKSKEVKVFSNETIVADQLVKEYKISEHRVINLYDSSGRERIDLYIFAIKTFLEKPIIGHGSSIAGELRFVSKEGRFRSIVHSYYLRIMQAFGLVGLLCLLAYLKSMFFHKYNFLNFMGILVIFIIFSFETYLYHWITLLAVFNRHRISES